MKRIIAIIALVILTTFTSDAQHYYTDIDEGIALAKEEGKSVLMIFSGSDWCKNCIKLRKDILDTEEFQKYSIDNLILLELDFPYSKKNQLSKEQIMHNDRLAEQYNSEGSFPKMILLDAQRHKLGVVNYKKYYLAPDIISQIEKIGA